MKTPKSKVKTQPRQKTLLMLVSLTFVDLGPAVLRF